jgi:hypothetical protein
LSGRGRKRPSKASATRRSQPTSKKGSGSGRSPRAGAGTHQQHKPGRSATGSRPGRRAGREELAARRRRNQRLGLLIGALLLAGVVVGIVFVTQGGGPTAAEESPDATSTSASPFTGPQAAAPTAATASTSAASTSAASASTAPVPPIVMTCPTGGGASPRFGHEIVVPEPYSVTIDYGDGDVYTNDSANLGAIFSHTYAEPGTYEVRAVLTVPDGGTASADCTYTWGP